MAADRLSLHLRVRHPGFELDVAEELPLDGFTAVFGPSGSGKSTLLRAVAGFETPLDGRIVWNGEVWFDAAAGVNLAPHRRPVGFMFQDSRLFPHLNVAGNLAFAYRRRQGAGPARDEVVAALDLGDLLHRRVHDLSGGERQRVALGRTLLRGPSLMLLDEPLAALDRQRKTEILPYLESVPARFRVPTLYVSHDVDEVARLADRVLVLAEGRVQTVGPTAAVMERLDLQPLTGGFEGGVLVEGRLRRHDARLHLSHVELAGGVLATPLLERLAPGQIVRLRIRARDVALATVRPEGLSIRNVLPGELVEIVDEPETGFVEAFVRLDGEGPPTRLRARITRAAVEDLRLEPGRRVYALIKSVSFESAGPG